MDAARTGELIRRSRESLGLTQVELAEQIGVTDKAVSKWERGAGCPDLSLVADVSRVLGLSVESILGGGLVENSRDTGNLRRIRLYRCPVCGNVITSSGPTGITCCGRPLYPLIEQGFDESHHIEMTGTDDELCLTWEHPMEKSHYLAFVAYVTTDRVLIARLYPEQSGELVIPRLRGGRLYSCCTEHGLFSMDDPTRKRRVVTSAKRT